LKVLLIVCNLCSGTFLLLTGCLQYTTPLANLIISYTVKGASIHLLQTAQNYPDFIEN